MEYLKMIDEMNGVFEFDYKNGNGHFSVNINAFFETVGSRDFKQFLDIVDLSNDPFLVAEKVHEIVFSRYQYEKSFSGYQSYNEKLVNKLSGFLDQLGKRYCLSIPEEEKQPEKIHVKKADVLTVWNENGEKVVKCFDGFKFSKFGYNCFLYRFPGLKRWIVILANCALQIAEGKTREEAISNFNERILEIINRKEKREFMRTEAKKFFDLVQESSFSHLFDADFCAVPDCFAIPEESQKEESAVMPSTEKEETSTVKKTQKEACATMEKINKKEESATIAECLQVEKEPEKNYNIIEKVFSISKRTKRPYKHLYISIVHFHAFQNKTPRNAIKTARNAIVLCPCLLDFSKNGKWIMENADFSHTGLFTTVSPRFSVGYSTGKSPPGGYQKFLPYFENKKGDYHESKRFNRNLPRF